MHVEFKWDLEKYEEMVASCQDNPTTPFIFKYIPKSGHILEAGCGMGHYVNFLSKVGYDICGIEVGKESVEAANKITPNLNIILSNIEKMPFLDNHFSGVVCLGVIEHIVEGPERALAEIYRVMKPGGIAIISVPVFNILRKIKYYSGVSWADYYLRKIYHKISGKSNIGWFDKSSIKVQTLNYHRWPQVGNFFEYRFTKKEISKKIRDAKFNIILEVPMEGAGGLYHEFGGVLVNNTFLKPVFKLLDKLFSFIPFFHHHTYLAVVRK